VASLVFAVSQFRRYVIEKTSFFVVRNWGLGDLDVVIAGAGRWSLSGVFFYGSICMVRRWLGRFDRFFGNIFFVKFGVGRFEIEIGIWNADSSRLRAPTTTSASPWSATTLVPLALVLQAQLVKFLGETLRL
jgi:hypothetical protein